MIWGLGVLLDPKFLLAVPFLLGMFLLLAFYAAALGVRFSLRCRSSLRAMAATLATALFVGGMYLFCCLPVLFMGGGRNKDGAILMLAPCVPFLLSLPGGVYLSRESYFRNDEGGFMLIAYVFGTIGYSVAIFTLAASAIGSFDALSGRTGRNRWASPRPLPKPPESPAEAVLVEPDAPQDS